MDQQDNFAIYKSSTLNWGSILKDKCVRHVVTGIAINLGCTLGELIVQTNNGLFFVLDSDTVDILCNDIIEYEYVVYSAYSMFISSIYTNPTLVGDVLHSIGTYDVARAMLICIGNLSSIDQTANYLATTAQIIANKCSPTRDNIQQLMINRNNELASLRKIFVAYEETYKTIDRLFPEKYIFEQNPKFYGKDILITMQRTISIRAKFSTLRVSKLMPIINMYDPVSGNHIVKQYIDGFFNVDDLIDINKETDGETIYLRFLIDESKVDLISTKNAFTYTEMRSIYKKIRITPTEIYVPNLHMNPTEINGFCRRLMDALKIDIIWKVNMTKLTYVSLFDFCIDPQVLRYVVDMPVTTNNALYYGMWRFLMQDERKTPTSAKTFFKYRFNEFDTSYYINFCTNKFNVISVYTSKQAKSHKKSMMYWSGTVIQNYRHVPKLINRVLSKYVDDFNYIASAVSIYDIKVIGFNDQHMLNTKDSHDILLIPYYTRYFGNSDKVLPERVSQEEAETLSHSGVKVVCIENRETMERMWFRSPPNSGYTIKVVKNTRVEVDKFPYLPKCTKTERTKTGSSKHVYQNMTKILNEDDTGTLPMNVSIKLRMPDMNVKRHGFGNTKCMLEHLIWAMGNPMYVHLNPLIAKQENSYFTPDEIVKLFYEHLDTRKSDDIRFIRFYEEMFNCNILVISVDNGGFMDPIIPSKSSIYVKPIRKRRRTVVIVYNTAQISGLKDVNRYEILVGDDRSFDMKNPVVDSILKLYTRKSVKIVDMDMYDEDMYQYQNLLECGYCHMIGTRTQDNRVLWASVVLPPMNVEERDIVDEELLSYTQLKYEEIHYYRPSVSTVSILGVWYNNIYYPCKEEPVTNIVSSNRKYLRLDRGLNVISHNSKQYYDSVKLCKRIIDNYKASPYTTPDDYINRCVIFVDDNSDVNVDSLHATSFIKVLHKDRDALRSLLSTIVDKRVFESINFSKTKRINKCIEYVIPRSIVKNGTDEI